MMDLRGVVTYGTDNKPVRKLETADSSMSTCSTKKKHGADSDTTDTDDDEHLGRLK